MNKDKGTSYKYNPDGSVTHSLGGERLMAPLGKEAAGDEVCEYRVLVLVGCASEER